MNDSEPTANCVLNCTIERVEQWGFYVLTEEGIRGFVDGMEISWTNADSGVFGVGESIRVKLLKHLSPPLEPEVYFLASIKALHPEQDPWHQPDIYRVGASFSGIIDRIHSEGAIVLLETGAVALAVLPESSRPALKSGSEVVVKVSKIDRPNRKIWAEL